MIECQNQYHDMINPLVGGQWAGIEWDTKLCLSSRTVGNIDFTMSILVDGWVLLVQLETEMK